MDTPKRTIGHDYAAQDAREGVAMPVAAWEVEINYMSCIVFAATKPKARWTAVRSYWDAFGRTPNWPTCIVGRRPHLDGKGDPKRAYAPNYF